MENEKVGVNGYEAGIRTGSGLSSAAKNDRPQPDPLPPGHCCWIKATLRCV